MFLYGYLHILTIEFYRVFLERVREMIEEANHIRITSLAGTDVEFNNNPKHPVYSRNGYADTPGHIS
jgi:leucyl aminopeptidase (aminopeptidase T)